jgi:glycosyltransferase involved in cell wall biosynthesis
MNILYINTERTWRGGERQTLLTATEMQERGHTVWLMCRAGQPLQEHARNSNLHLLPVSPVSSWDPFLALKLKSIANEKNIEIIHAQTAHAVSLASLARRFGCKSRLVASRRVDFPVRSQRKYNSTNAIIAISKAIREVLVESGVDKALISVIPSGVDTSIAPHGDRESIRGDYWPEPCTIIGSVGHLAYHKGYDVLLMAWPQVLAALPQARLLLVGEGEERGKLEHIIAQHNLSDTVALAGFQKDVASYISSFDYYVQPSRTEGLGSTLIDAMLLEKPIIASDAGGIPEVCDNGRFCSLAEPENEDDLARKIITSISNSYCYNPSDAREWVKQNFSKEVMVERTENLYREIMK